MQIQSLDIQDYFKHRLNELSLPISEAKRHGLSVDQAGNILQHFRYFSGEQVTFIPVPKRAQYAKILARKTICIDSHIESFNQELTLLRYAPGNRPPGHGKYKFPAKSFTGLGVLPMPTNSAIKAYKTGKQGGTIFCIEGYFKALSLSLQNVESFAFTGITTYKLCEQTTDYLVSRQPENFVIMYDSDALNVSEKELITDQRVNSFYRSALNFAGEFFNFCTDFGLKINLHFCMLNPGQHHKGIDDLITASDDKGTIIANLQSLKTNKDFTFLKLSRTTFKNRLQAFFGLSNHREFYHHHREQIKQNPFRFAGVLFKQKLAARHYNLLNYKKEYHTFTILDQPFAVDIQTREKHVNKYVAESKKELDKLLAIFPKIAIQAPPGAGKTSFFIDYAKRKNKLFVITVPLKSLCKQLSNKHEITALYGTCTAHQRAKLMTSKVIVCTYDMIGHIQDLEHRGLIVDESHNLINAHGYRCKAVQSVFNACSRAKQAVLLSGTQSKYLAKYADFQYIEIARKENPIYNVYEIEADQASKIVTFLSQFEKINLADNRIHFCYLNNKKSLHEIKDYLISRNILKADEIAVITRADIEAGNVAAYDEILQHEEIRTKVKLVLCTCLIAEGVNIENTNIGNIYCIGIGCVDSFRQFSARFRKMNELFIYSIRDKETRPGTAFKINPDDSIQLALDSAKLQLDYIKKTHRETLQNDYSINDLNYIEKILPEYKLPGQSINLVFNRGNEFYIDLLAILFQERQRKIDATFNAAFYSELSLHGFTVQGIKTGAICEETKQYFSDLQKANLDLKAGELEAIKTDLKAMPGTVLAAARLHAENSRSSTTHFDYASDILKSAEGVAAEKYLYEHRTGFQNNWFAYLIKAYCKFVHLDISDKQISKIIASTSKSNLDKFYRALLVCAEISAYDNRRQRNQLSIMHKAEIKAKKRIKAEIKVKADQAGGNITSTDLLNVINDIWTKRTIKPDLSGVTSVAAVKFSPEKARYLIESFFSIQTVIKSNHTEYIITDDYTGTANFLHALCVHFFQVETGNIACNPLKIIDMYKL